MLPEALREIEMYLYQLLGAFLYQPASKFELSRTVVFGNLLNLAIHLLVDECLIPHCKHR